MSKAADLMMLAEADLKVSELLLNSYNANFKSDHDSIEKANKYIREWMDSIKATE